MQPLCHAVRFAREGIRANDLASLCHFREELGHGGFARVGSTQRRWRTDFVQLKEAA